MYPGLPWTATVYVHCSSIIIHSSPFHSQNCSNLDGHDVNVRGCVWSFRKEHEKYLELMR